MEKGDGYMHKKGKVSVIKIISTSLVFSLLAAPLFPSHISANGNGALQGSGNQNSIFKLRIMETTDVHTNLVNYDYYKNAGSEKVGLAKTAALVKQARKEVSNSILVDNGDLIQGTPLGTYKAKIDPLQENEVHPAIKAMNLMQYDMATLGNHEFNYGLAFLDEVYDDANFPFVNANVYVDDHDNNPENDRNQYKPYQILNKKITDQQGKTQVIKIGFIGFVPPQINEWDKAHLEGKVVTKNVVETAEKFVPEMRKKGADIVIALAHTGFSGNVTNTEDTIYALSKVPGIDAITFSHTHKLFPAKTEAALDGLFLDSDKKPLPGVDNAKGTIHGIPAVQAGYGGGSLGLIDLTLEKDKGKWKVVDSQSSTREGWAVDPKDPKKTISTVEPDPAILKAIQADHEGTIAYVNTPIGTTTDDIHSYFALVQDDPSIQVVTNAQKWYVEKYVAMNKPEYKDLPILSVGAPFKAGRNGVEEFTEIKQGDLTIRSAGDLYLYDNTLKAIKVKGSVVKEWIEMSAGKFNQIDVNQTEEQPLLNPAFQVFNFDVIDGVQYQIDVTKPAKYDPTGNVINPDSSRVVNLTHNGQPVNPDQEFIVVTNNYRAGGGGNFPGLKGSELVVDSADENRQILMDYISEVKEIVPTADQNWSIAPIAKPVNVTFTTSPKAASYIKEGSKIAYTEKLDDKGFGIFTINLGGSTTEPEPKETIKVQLLGVNDLHGQLDTDTKLGSQLAGSMEYTAAAMKQRESQNPNTLLVHAGDMIGGSPLISALFQDEPTVEVMEAMGFDVGTLGNHEFDEGIAELHRMIDGGEHPKGTKGYDGMNFPIVAANAYDSATGKLITEPYVVKEVGGQKIGFIGVVTQETPNMIVRKGNETLEITSEVDAINQYTAELKKQGIRAIVVLAHNPTLQTGKADAFDATDIAENVDDEVDVIFAGHNHVYVDKVVDNKLIVQAYSYGSAYSDVDVELDPATGDIVQKAAEVVTVYQKDYTPDPTVAAIMKKYEDLIAPIKAEVVGESAVGLSKGYPSLEEYGDLALGNLIADAMKASMNADFALMNGGGIRSDLPAGKVTFGHLFAIQPFGNVLNKVKLNGADLETVLNNQITDRGLDFHIAGFTYTYSYDSAAKTGKVVDISLPDGSKIDKTKEYTVVVNNYMYGNLKYGIGALSTDLEVGPDDLTATVEYVKSLPKPFEYKGEGRIQKVAAPVVAP